MILFWYFVYFCCILLAVCSLIPLVALGYNYSTHVLSPEALVPEKSLAIYTVFAPKWLPVCTKSFAICTGFGLKSARREPLFTEWVCVGDLPKRRKIVNWDISCQLTCQKHLQKSVYAPLNSIKQDIGIRRPQISHLETPSRLGGRYMNSCGPFGVSIEICSGNLPETVCRPRKHARDLGKRGCRAVRSTGRGNRGCGTTRAWYRR